MAAQTLSETEFRQWVNESFARLESKLQTILSGLQAIRTAWGTLHTTTPHAPVSVSASTPSPVSTATPQSIAEPSPKYTVVAAHPRLLAPVTTPPTTTTSPGDIATVPTLTHSGLLCGIHDYHQWSYSQPKTKEPLAKHIPSLLGFQGYHHNVPKHARKFGKSHVEFWYGATSREKFGSQDEKSLTAWTGLVVRPEPKVSPVIEWCPPWSVTTLRSDAPGIMEWRPPWCVAERCPDFILEDKDFLTGRDCYVQPTLPCTHISS